MKTIQFKIGETYSCVSICDADCKFVFKVVKRTTKTISISGRMIDGIVRRKIGVYDGVECVNPLGCYPMSPVLEAK